MKKIVQYLFFSIFFLFTPFIYVQAQGTGASVNFDIQPRTVGPVQVTLGVAVFKTTLINFCTNFTGLNSPNAIHWEVNEILPNGENAGIRQGNVSLDDFTDSIAKNLSFPTTIGPRPPLTPRTFFAVVYCRSILGIGRQVTRSSPDIVLSQLGGGGGGGGGINQTVGWGIFNPFAGNPQNVFQVVFLIVDWIANIAGSLVIIMIIYSGIKFLISKGNPGEIQQAKSILWWALVGMAVVIVGKGFVFIVDSILRNQIPIS